jgi:hypothetical protein
LQHPCCWGFMQHYSFLYRRFYAVILCDVCHKLRIPSACTKVSVWCNLVWFENYVIGDVCFQQDCNTTSLWE